MRIKSVNSKIYQLDVMDGKFVKNKSLMFDFKLPKSKKYEAHLMIKNPEVWIEKNWKKVNTIIFHLESLKNPDKVIGLIKNKKMKVGIAINPQTSIEKIKIHINEIDLVLVMTVNPGKYGSKFIPKTLEKVRQIRKLNPNIEIEVDGGINDKTIRKTLSAGANRFVSGSYIQNSENPKKSFEKLKRIIKT
jgi:ribulose-phosphate 3-epimerase